MDEARKNKKLPRLSFDSYRRFGLELEINAFDGLNRPKNNGQPKGTEYVVSLLSKVCEEGVEARSWEHTHGNSRWIVKPDSSCGLEICSPPLKGWKGVKKLCNAVEALGKDSKIKADSRCSVHVHIEVSDLSKDQLASVIAHWIKCEPVFLDSVPAERKRNRYCQFIGMTDLFEHDVQYTAEDIVNRVGNVKYYTLNTNQMKQQNRSTIEFRIIEGAGAKDPFLIKNWIRLLLHFVEMASKRPLPSKYNEKENTQWSSLVWLDTEDVLKLLGFSNNPKEYELSNGLEQTRNWFLARLRRNMAKDVNNQLRSVAYNELIQILERFKNEGIEIGDDQLHPPEHVINEVLYSDNLRF